MSTIKTRLQRKNIYNKYRNPAIISEDDLWHIYEHANDISISRQMGKTKHLSSWKKTAKPLIIILKNSLNTISDPVSYLLKQTLLSPTGGQKIDKTVDGRIFHANNIKKCTYKWHTLPIYA
ncbi:unnamed protein product [Cuscuta epithymum]|uniref:Uncharacterized protein n=1 Tax=Cuscuta epithymum TaxID=186058 RepID=A0AAV0FPX1_9ASTE|nr:unnamed protein product [Cuscuta epithymum]